MGEKRNSIPATSNTVRWPVLNEAAAVYLAVGLIAVALIIVYSDSLSVPFLFDDIPAIQENTSIRSLGTLLTPPADTSASGRPVLNATFALDFAIGGLNPLVYHVTNLVIHGAAAALLFGILRRTLRPMQTRAGPVSLFATLLWAVHPLNTEAVTYTVQRAESLMGLFYLATFYGFIRATEPASKHPQKWFLLSLLGCVLGMATKEVMVSAPILVLAYDSIFISGNLGKALRVRWRIHMALMGTWIVLLVLLVRTGGRTSTVGFETAVTWWRYSLTQLVAVTRYVFLFFWPRSLVLDYGTVLSELSPALILYACPLIAIGGLTLWSLARHPRLGFLGLAFLAILAPTSSFVPIATQTMAEHRMYLASITLAVLVAIAVDRYLGRYRLLFLVPTLCLLGAATYARNLDYRSALSIWTDTASKFPKNARAYLNLGKALEKQPDSQEAQIAAYQKALSIQPRYPEAHMNLGSVLAGLPGRSGDAMREFEAALAASPHLAAAHYDLGTLYMEAGRNEEAEGHFRQAIASQPDLFEAHFNLGITLGREGKLEDAVAENTAAVKLNPLSAEAHYDLGNSLFRIGRLSDAIPQYREAIRIRSGFINARMALAKVLMSAGKRNAEAEAQLRAVIEMDPGNQLARNWLSEVQGLDAR